MSVLLDVRTCEINCSLILLEGMGGLKEGKKKNHAVDKGAKAIIIDSPLYLARKGLEENVILPLE